MSVTSDLDQELGDLFNKECRWHGVSCSVSAAEREAFLKALITLWQKSVLTQEPLTRALLATDKYKSKQEQAAVILKRIGSW